MVADIENIVRGCQKKQRPAQERFYKHFYRYAMSICMPYSQSKFEAEEVANDGFMKVFSKFDQYDDKYPVEVWLRRIMINTAIDFFRSQKKHYHQLDISEPRALENVDISILDKLSAEEVMRHIQDLPPSYRAAFTLASIEGYKHHEIAKMLNISEGASKSNLAKAKAKLKKSITATNYLKD
ncbi:MAG: RNA polymerase sigma factor [Cyclobacteriaceae bacterium]